MAVKNIRFPAARLTESQYRREGKDVKVATRRLSSRAVVEHLIGRQDIQKKDIEG